MLHAAFDATATGYDAEFTHTQTGKYQRLQVWRQLISLSVSGKKVLEMNCGTGEDALFLAREKAMVTATDISLEMLSVSAKKTNRAVCEDTNGGGLQVITFIQWDLNQDFPIVCPEKFDLAFSNFGGWNCLSAAAIGKLGERLSGLLGEKGQVCVVIMPSFCVWETIYFLLKGKISAAFRRRNRQGVYAQLNDTQSVLTYYYSPRKIESLLSPYFSVKKVRPIGFFLPPSYLDNFCKKVPFLLPVLFFLEKCVAWLPFLSYFSDHYLMVLEKKES